MFDRSDESFSGVSEISRRSEKKFARRFEKFREVLKKVRKSDDRRNPEIVRKRRNSRNSGNSRNSCEKYEKREIPEIPEIPGNS
jgi:hypothetical protein